MSQAPPPSCLPAYMAITAHDGQRILLPLGAAGRSRFLHDLMEGLHLTHQAVLDKRTTAADVHATENSDTATQCNAPLVSLHNNERCDLYASRATTAQAHTREESQATSDNKKHNVPFLDGGEEEYTCYARGYPSFTMTHEATLSAADGTASVAAAPPSPLLEVPLACVEGETMTRIAEFLVYKACATALTGRGTYNPKLDPLRGLDSASPVDQLLAIRLLLGSDLLGC